MLPPILPSLPSTALNSNVPSSRSFQTTLPYLPLSIAVAVTVATHAGAVIAEISFAASPSPTVLVFTAETTCVPAVVIFTVALPSASVTAVVFTPSTVMVAPSQGTIDIL